MSHVAQVSKEFAVTATCDQCGTTESWVQLTDPEWSALDQGWGFYDFTSEGYEPERLWFHAPECVHAWIDSHVLYPPVEVPA